jgi:phospholipid/cholesterol/gamma-HCH transport system substrate-binding protein
MFRRGLRFSPKVIGAVTMVVFFLLVYVAYTAINGAPGVPYADVDVTFPTASNLVQHDDVRVDSDRIGQVETITYKNGAAHLQLELNPGTKVYNNATASIGDVSALGSEYVELDPGTPSAGRLDAAGIPASRTTTPVEIDTVLSVLRPAQRDALAATVQTLGGAFGGQSQNINDLLATAPSLLPNLGTVTDTLAENDTQLIPLLQATNLLASRFDGRTQQLGALLGQANTTLKAIDTQNTQALQATIDDASPALTAATPALTDLASTAANTRDAVAALRPGLAAAGANTPNLRGLLREGVAPLDQVPGVATDATPGLTDLAQTSGNLQKPVAPFLAELFNRADPLLTYISPYSSDISALFANLSSSLSDGDGNGNWLRLSLYLTPSAADPVSTVNSLLGAFLGSSGSSLIPATANFSSLTPVTDCRDPYPAPGQAATDRGPTNGACPS